MATDPFSILGVDAAVGHCDSAVLRPIPIRPPIERIGELADFALVRAFARKVLRGSQHPGEQKGAVDRRQFAGPDALSADHVEKVVVETRSHESWRPCVIGNVCAIATALGFASASVAMRRGHARDYSPAIFGYGLVACTFSALVCLGEGVSLVSPLADVVAALAGGSIWTPRSRRPRSRPDRAQEHRRAYPGVYSLEVGIPAQAKPAPSPVPEKSRSRSSR